MAKRKSTKKLPAVSKREKGKAPSSAKTVKADRAPSQKASARPKPSAKPQGKVFPIACSECFHEYLVTVVPGVEEMTCPVCGHVCRMPESDFWAKYATHLANQRKHALLGGVFLTLALLSTFGWLLLQLNLPFAIRLGLVGEDGNLGTLNTVGLVGSLIFWLLVAVEAYFYEKSTYRSYF